MVVGTRFVVVGEVLSLNGVGLGVACNWWVGGVSMVVGLSFLWF